VPRKAWFDWKSLATELFVVFIGLLAALQVDDWRERRELARTETVYLHRLSEDLNEYVRALHTIIPVFEERRRAVAHVNGSFAAGQILNGDTALFESGLIFVAHLPSVNRPRAAYDEMVASGVFARLRSPELQRAVAELENALQTLVEYYSDDTERVPSTTLAPGSEGRRIRYDFEQLRSQPAIRNGFYWAEDTHSDWVEWSRRLLELAVTADAIVTKELQGR
jgi:hypothetical protein